MQVFCHHRCATASTRQAGLPSSRRAAAKDKRFVLTMADLQAALEEQGVGVAKPPYYV
jgi:hypothetical protein